MIALEPRPCTFAEMSEFRFSPRPSFAREKFVMKRQLWEWLVVARLFDFARPLRSLGFGVGCEPLPAWMASKGHQVVATDAAPQGRWREAGQHAGGDLGTLNADGLCEPAAFLRLVSLREVDMRSDLSNFHDGFDFVWSCCALEHLGGLSAGLDFLERSLRCLAPGGLAVHTTEFNVTSNGKTIDQENLCAYRRQDIDALVERLRKAGYWLLAVDWAAWHPDVPGETVPEKPHLTFRLGDYDLTSFVLPIVRPR